jgi:hypothetical protein
LHGRRHPERPGGRLAHVTVRHLTGPTLLATGSPINNSQGSVTSTYYHAVPRREFPAAEKTCKSTQSMGQELTACGVRRSLSGYQRRFARRRGLARSVGVSVRPQP